MGWLKEKNYLDRLVLNSLQVKKMTIVHADMSMLNKISNLVPSANGQGAYRILKEEVHAGQSVTDIFESSKDKIIVTDKVQLEKYLHNPDFAVEKRIYYVKIDVNDNSYQIWTVNNTLRIGFQVDNMYSYGLKD